jgi:predicted  nucleic acid-binding Zn-ribbon protein
LDENKEKLSNFEKENQGLKELNGLTIQKLKDLEA